MAGDTLEHLIRSRRSVRKYSGEPVSDQLVERILEAGRWAPSGMNNQPWRFALVRDAEVKERISQQTRYGSVVRAASVLICLFMHKPSGYHALKDAQAIGACCQNMLLMAHGLGLGAVWLGEILKNAEAVRTILELEADLELMAVLAVGWPQGKTADKPRAPLAELVVGRF